MLSDAVLSESLHLAHKLGSKMKYQINIEASSKTRIAVKYIWNEVFILVKLK